MNMVPEDKRVLAALLSCLDSNNFDGRDARPYAIGLLPQTPFKKEAVQALMTVLRTDKNAAYRAAAAQSLGELGPDAKPAVKYLELSKVDSSAAVREAADIALKKINGDG